MIVEELQKHLDDIAEEFGCKMVQERGMEGMMYVEERPPRIEGPTLQTFYFNSTKISEVGAYLIMLHELGHVYHGHTQGRPPYEDEVYYFENGVLRSEAEAWNFTLDNTIVDPSDKDIDFIVNSCIMSYLYSSRSYTKVNLYNGNRHWHNGKYDWDTADDYFVNTVERMRNAGN